VSSRTKTITNIKLFFICSSPYKV